MSDERVQRIMAEIDKEITQYEEIAQETQGARYRWAEGMIRGLLRAKRIIEATQ